jgi:hypothetical protein
MDSAVAPTAMVSTIWPLAGLSTATASVPRASTAERNTASLACCLGFQRFRDGQMSSVEREEAMVYEDVASDLDDGAEDLWMEN